MSSAPPVLRLQSLCFSYPDTLPVFNNLNLTIHSGEKVGLVGPNGAGKSTLFLLSTGILAPTSGSLEMLGIPVKKGGFNPKLGLVFQHTDDQLFCPTVWEDVAFGLRNMGLNNTQVNAKVEEALTAVGGMQLAERTIHHLSGGEKRIVAIAGILAMEPEMIIYDEPSTGLDMRTRRRLMPILKTASPTALIASHDLELLLETCTRIVVLDNGVIVADGDPKIILGDKDLMQAHGQEKPHSLIVHIHKSNTS